MSSVSTIRAQAAEARWRDGYVRWKLSPTQRWILEKMETAWGLPIGGLSDPKNAAPRGAVIDQDEFDEATFDDSQDVDSLVIGEAEKDDILSQVNVPLFFLLAHRGLGKTFLFVVLCVEMCLRIKQARILYLAPDGGTDAVTFFRDVAELFVLHDCPADLLPKYNGATNEYEFKHNGSVIRFRGTNGAKIEKARGPGNDLIVLDECGGMDDLRYAVLGVLASTANRFGGHIAMATTVPKQGSDHESWGIYEQLLKAGLAVSVTIRESERIPWRTKALELLTNGESRQDIKGILDGTKSPMTVWARREFFNEPISDAGQVILPEWTDTARLECVRATPNVVLPMRGYSSDGRPSFCDRYVAMDPGWKDYTGLIFGYLDYPRQVFVVEHSEVIPQAGTQQIADAIAAAELSLWGGDRPLMRVSDIDHRLISDLTRDHRLAFSAADKSGRLVDRITNVRQTIAGKKIEILPGAHLLDSQMRAATWNKTASDFERTAAGHYDLVAALMYLLRHVAWRRDPYPLGWRVAQDDRQTMREAFAPPAATGLIPKGGMGDRMTQWLLRRRP